MVHDKAIGSSANCKVAFEFGKWWPVVSTSKPEVVNYLPLIFQTNVFPAINVLNAYENPMLERK